MAQYLNPGGDWIDEGADGQYLDPASDWLDVGVAPTPAPAWLAAGRAIAQLFDDDLWPWWRTVVRRFVPVIPVTPAAGTGVGPFVPDPRGRTFEQWAGALQAANQNASIFNYTVMPWKDWARTLYWQSTFSAIVIPDPQNYQDWRDWAFALRGNGGGAG